VKCMRLSTTKKILVIGAGKSGVSAARLLLKHGHSVILFDDKGIDTLKHVDADLIGDSNLLTHFHAGALAVDHTVQTCILSPGIDPQHPLVQQIKMLGIPLYNEIDLALNFLPKHKIIGITGTNGKSTTTVMLLTILNAAHKKTYAAGNLGTPLCELAIKPFDYEYVVLELSSFQLGTLRHIKLAGAIIINITPDHLDRHTSYEEYRDAKLSIASLLAPGGVLVANQNLAASCNLNPPKNCPLRFFSSEQFGRGELAFLAQATLYGEHNKENAVAAATMALALGIESQAIIAGLNNFTPLPHRCELVAEQHGITFINDSKGTTVVAVEKALSMSKKPTHLLLGGIEKGEDFSALSTKHFPHIKGYYVYGQAKSKITRELNSAKTHNFSDLTEAFLAAVSKASPGDIILLSPGCASFDQFDNYHHRGETFRKLVQEMVVSPKSRV
jgi:UDP-N-acetylmuramoylalanine--D-glutamate ligase